MKSEFGCVIMASGMSRRFGSNKLLTDFRGAPLAARIMDATEGLFAKRVVVTRHEAVAALARARGIDAVLHDLPDRSDTIRLGLEAVGDVDMCMFCPADQPMIRRKTVAALVRVGEADRRMIYRPSCKGEVGAPVLFPQWAFSELRTLPRGKGGGVVARKYADRVRTLEVSDASELMDADTPEMLDYLRNLPF